MGSVGSSLIHCSGLINFSNTGEALYVTLTKDFTLSSTGSLAKTAETAALSDKVGPKNMADRRNVHLLEK